MTLQLSTHFVAFIDLLGFSEMVRSDCESSEGPKYLDLLYKVHQDATVTLGRDIEAGLIQFSDSIVFSRPFDLTMLEEFLRNVANWQKNLLLSGLLCRGGITFGKHFVKDRFMFSKGLIDAYLIEKTQARFPRIVISDDLIQLASTQVTLDGLPLIIEDDGLVFVDYMCFDNQDEQKRIENAVLHICANASSDASIQEKTRWLAHYADHKLATEIAGPRFS